MDAARAFAWLDQIADDRALPPVSVRVAVVLRRFFNQRTGAAWPSQATLMDVTALSRSCLQSALRALVERGHLSVDVQRGRGATNEYRPALWLENAREKEHFPPENARESEHLSGEKARKSEQGVPGNQSRGARKSERGVPGNVSIELLEGTHRSNPANELNVRLTANKVKSPAKSVSSDSSDDDADDDFAAFWSAYPRRVAKGAARRAFAAALKKTSAENLIAGAQRYANATASTEPRFVKHPATWLNAEGWLDEAVPARLTVIDGEGREVPTSPLTSRPKSIGEIVDSWGDLRKYAPPW